MTTSDESVDLRDIAATLNRAVLILAGDGTIKARGQELARACSTGDQEKITTAVSNIDRALAPIRSLIKLAEDVDPHTISSSELDRLLAAKSTDLAKDAVSQGNFRERRIILEARDVATNRLLARVAIAAALVALAIPFIERLLVAVF